MNRLTIAFALLSVTLAVSTNNLQLAVPKRSSQALQVCKQGAFVVAVV